MCVSGFFQCTTDKSNIVGCTASTTGLTDDDSNLIGIVFAGKNCLHNLADHHQ